MIQLTKTVSGFPSRTISIDMTDNPQSIPAAQLNQDERPVISALLSCETNPLRFTFGDADPSIANGNGHVMYPGYNFLRIDNFQSIETLQLCNGTAGLNSIAHITLEFERSVI